VTGNWRPADTDRYMVYDRGDVREKLEELGVENVGQIRRAHGSYHHKLAHAQDTERLDLHATGSPDQIAANLAALASAKKVLVEQADAVNELLDETNHLATPMSDGHGPIARAMRTAFRERADDVQGAVRALTDYRDELTLVLAAIQQTMDSYDRSEQTATRWLSTSGSDDA
jgi:hypothetical protein